MATNDRAGKAETGTEEVNEAVDDGGGCAEAWEAMAELRDADVDPSRMDDGCDGDLEALDDLDVADLPDDLDEGELPDELTEQLTDEQLEQVEKLATSKNFARFAKLVADGDLADLGTEGRGPTASRRGVLKSAGAAAGAAASFPLGMSTVAAAASKDHIDARKLDGDERDAVLDEMESRGDYWDIEGAMYDDGWDQVDRSEWQALEVTDHERDVVYETAHVGMEPADGSAMPEDESCAIEYTNDPDADDPVRGTHTDHEPDDREFVPDTGAKCVDSDAHFWRRPTWDSEWLAEFPEGETARVYGGPVYDADGNPWYFLDLESDDISKGWVSGYFIESAPFFKEESARTAWGGADLYSDNNTDSWAAWKEEDTPCQVWAGPWYNDGHDWYYVYFHQTEEEYWIKEADLMDDQFKRYRMVETTHDWVEVRDSPCGNVDHHVHEGEQGRIESAFRYDCDGEKWWKVHYVDSDVWGWTQDWSLESIEDPADVRSQTEWLHDGSSVYRDEQTTQKDDFERELQGSNRDAVIQEVKDDWEYQAIRDQMSSDDGVWPADDSEWSVSDVYDPETGELYQTVEVYYWESDYHITYNNAADSDLKVEGLRSEHVTDVEDPYYDQTLWRYDHDNGTVVSMDRELPNFWWCGSVDWGCVLLNASAWAGTIGACGTCATGWGFFACASCIGAILGSGGTWLKCNVCA